MVAAGDADIAALDCVTFAHIQRLYSQEAAPLRVLCWTPASPSLPFITACSSDDSTVRVLRSALADLFAQNDAMSARQLLFLDGIDLHPDSTFSEVLKLERRAVAAGYPRIG
jgi:ABC-type phosphate/phosphonate transport system substrate-binding protein